MGEDRLGLDAMNILGEVLWHAATLDPSIVEESHNHLREVLGHVQSHWAAQSNDPVRFLEVASYAHITGYILTQQHGWRVTLPDISVDALAPWCAASEAEWAPNGSSSPTFS
jgi:hypothetical protein